MDIKQIAAARRALIRDIRKAIDPHLWESGFRTPITPSKGIFGGTRPVRLWVPRDANGRATDKSWNLGGHVLEHVEGITENGPITDSHMCIVTTYWAGIPIEDLIKLKAWVDKVLVKAAKPMDKAA